MENLNALSSIDELFAPASGAWLRIEGSGAGEA